MTGPRTGDPGLCAGAAAGQSLRSWSEPGGRRRKIRRWWCDEDSWQAAIAQANANGSSPTTITIGCQQLVLSSAVFVNANVTILGQQALSWCSLAILCTAIVCFSSQAGM